MIPVILSGGSGSCLWPLSRKQHPKQFLRLVGSHTLFQQTVMRLSNLEAPIVVCHQQHRFILHEQLTAIDARAQLLVLEPFGRNTAPAVAMVALQLLAEGRDELLVVCPADHVVTNERALQNTLELARPAAEAGELVLFGIPAQHPETEYGYVHCSTQELLANGLQRVDRFVEKPDLATAEAFLAEGDHYWNSGMLLVRASRFLEQLQRHAPSVYDACVEVFQASTHTGGTLRIAAGIFASCPDTSIERALLQHTAEACLIPLEVGWSDIGSWSSLLTLQDKDEHGNVVQGDVVVDDCHNCLVHATSKRVTLLGLDDVVVVETRDAVLVAHKDRIQDVKHLVSELDGDQQGGAQTGRRVFRPGGAYDALGSGQRHRVKHITLNPGASLSLQRHHHRAEHWIVVSGLAQVSCGEKTFLLSEDQSTYIPETALHRLSDPGKVPLELIEVQSGSYLGEDDIERLDDVCGRTEDQTVPLRRIVAM